MAGRLVALKDGCCRVALDVEVVTLFPEMVDHAARFGVTGRAIERGRLSLLGMLIAFAASGDRQR